MEDTQYTTAKPTPTAKGIWGNIRLAVRRKFDWKGRSTRAEFWSYTVFSSVVCFSLLTILCMLLQQLVSLDLDDQTTHAEADRLLLSSFLLLVALIISTVLLGIPWIAVLLRRLHDLGKKGWSILVSIILNGLSLYGMWLIIHLLSISDYKAIGPIALICAWVLAIPVALVLIAALVLNLLIFINCLRPGQSGANAFGAPAR